MRTRSLPISLRFRVGSYVSLAVWSAVLVIFAVYRILYTLSPQNSASLNTRRAFYGIFIINMYKVALNVFFFVCRSGAYRAHVCCSSKPLLCGSHASLFAPHFFAGPINQTNAGSIFYSHKRDIVWSLEIGLK